MTIAETDNCPVAYDHSDEVGQCMVFGWSLSIELSAASAPKDMDKLTGSQRLRETIARLSGNYAPTQPIMFNCKG